MLNLDKFPLEIGALKRKQGSNAFVNDSSGMACLVDTKENKISFGLFRPAGAHFGTFSVNDEKEAIQIIKDFKVGDKKITDYSPYDDKDKIDPLGLEKKISNLEEKIAVLENTIIDLEHRLDSINDRLEASYL
ncbi:MAG: hypothetical protein J6M14_01990 [Campylobacter sp.]|nr:hypothetical protein [Campylobacter sp.]